MKVDGREFDVTNDKDYYDLLNYIIKSRGSYMKNLGEFQGLYDKYLVINNKTGKLQQGVFVLNPMKDVTARKSIQCYADNTDNVLLSNDLKRWMKEFTDYECISPNRSVCSKVGTKVCCCHCLLKEECYDEGGPLCYLTSSGNIQSRKECEDSDLY